MEGVLSMLRKVKFILAFMALSICLCIMSSTYSRYVADATGNIDVLFAKWQILVNENDITNASASEISFIPIIEENENVAPNVVAPSSKGYFDININPSNVQVSFQYSITLEIENENMPDLMITKYSIIPEGYIEGDPLDVITLENNIITNSLLFDKNTADFHFAPFSIRVYFEWYEGENETMNDESDSTVGNTAATSEEGTNFTMKANILFEQLIN